MYDQFFKAILEKYKLQSAKLVPQCISPNMISVGGMIISLLGACVFAGGCEWTGFWIIVFSIVTDGLDGGVARLRGMSSQLGGYLDIVTDFATYCSIPMMMAFREDSKYHYFTSMLLLMVWTCNGVSTIYAMLIYENESQARNIIVKLPRSICEAGETYTYMLLCFFLTEYRAHLHLAYAILCTYGIIKRTQELADLLKSTKTLPDGREIVYYR